MVYYKAYLLEVGSADIHIVHAVIQTCTDNVCVMEEDMPNKDTNIWKLQMLHHLSDIE